MTFSNNRTYTVSYNTEMVFVIVPANVRNEIPFNAIFADFMKIEKYADSAHRKSRNVSSW